MRRRLLATLAVAALAASAFVTLGAAPTSAQTGPVGYSSGAFLSGAGIDCSLFRVDLSTGEATEVNPGDDTDHCADGLTFSSDGTLYAYTNQPTMGFPLAQLVTIDTATGAQTVIGDLPPVNAGSGGMTFDAAGNLWLYGVVPAIGVDPDCSSTDFESCLWRVDPATAETTFVGVAPGPSDFPFGLAATCESVQAITTSVATGPTPIGSALQTVDTATAGLTTVVDLPDVSNPQGLDYDADGRLWAIGSPPFAGAPFVSVFLIDPATGASESTPVTVGGSTAFSGFLDGLAVSPLSCEEPTPEPIIIQPTFTG